MRKSNVLLGTLLLQLLTQSSTGIRRGKLMAKEHTGIILVLLITIKSPKGQEIMKHRNTHFQNGLSSTEMPPKDVEHCPKRFQNIMCSMKRISGRTRGMGLKTTKFHCILHMPEDMMAYGVPVEASEKPINPNLPHSGRLALCI